jgi:SAM-dependent methyltransferase
MVSSDRWQTAQEYERGYWKRRAREIAQGATSQLGWYQWRSDQLQQKLRHSGLSRLLQGDATVLEVGSGPVGVAGFFPAGERILVDPLADYYAENAELVALRNRSARYIGTPGEAIPVPEASVDLVICENCIDHVSDCHAVMREIGRVLRPDGVLYLTVNCRSRPGYFVHRALSSCRLDPGHPHTFTPNRLRRLLIRHGFAPAVWEIEDFTPAWLADLRSSDRTARLKAVLGVSEYLALVIAPRTELKIPDGRRPRASAGEEEVAAV